MRSLPQPADRRAVRRLRPHQLIALCAALAACGKGGGTSLPEKRPDDLRITVSSHGGMVPIGDHTVLEHGKGVHVHSEEQEEQRVTFDVSEDELDALWSVYRRERFDRIRTRERKMYDAPGIALNISYGDQSFSAGESGGHEIDPAWSGAWGSCLGATERLIAEHVEPAALEIQIHRAPDLAGLPVQAMGCGSRQGTLTDDVIRIKTLPGTCPLRMWIDGTTPVDVVVDTARAVLDLRREGDALVLTPR